MHNSFEGSANVEREADANGLGGNLWRAYGSGTGPALLKANSQSGACLNCHEPGVQDTAPSSYHISTVGINANDATTPVEMTPGGDFAWLKKTMNYTVRGSAKVNDGDRHGHNIVAVDFGYNADKVNLVAPNAQTQGTGYPAGNLACSSCHDPHGRYRRDASGAITKTGLPIFNSGSYSNSKAPIASVSAVGVYRLLAGDQYQPVSVTGSWAFTAPPPAAVAPSTNNRSEATGGQTHVVYGSGMSEWCGNCHGGMHSNTVGSDTAILASGNVHPAGNGAKLTQTIVNNYNAYVSSGIMTNTDVNKAYSTLAPFETGNGQTLNDYTAMKALAVNTDTVNHSAQTTSNVMCLSCHRAHASAFESMTRYMLANEFMTTADSTNAATYDTAGAPGQGYSVAQQTAAYYGRPATVFGPYARNYCNKCHAKD
jgi:predicted CXXCH cytochrome family protein